MESFSNFQNKTVGFDSVPPRENLQILVLGFNKENIKTEIKNFCSPKSVIRLNSGTEIIGLGDAMREVYELLS